MPKNGLSGIMLCTGDHLDISEQGKQSDIREQLCQTEEKCNFGGLEYSLTLICVCRDLLCYSHSNKKTCTFSHTINYSGWEIGTGQCKIRG